MDTSRAFAAGVAGGAAMTVLMALGRLVLGMDMDLEMLMGTMVFEPGPVAWGVGLGIHLMMSGAIALGYAFAFERLGRASAGLGAAFSVAHMLVAAVVMGGMIPLVHRLVPEQMPGPGYFLSNHGTMGIVAFVMLHLVFGAIVGSVYAGHVGRRA